MRTSELWKMLGYRDRQKAWPFYLESMLSYKFTEGLLRLVAWPHAITAAAAAAAAVVSVVSDSVWPRRWQPTRLPHPWDSPGKNTGVGCHVLLQCMKVKSESEFTQLHPTLRNPMDCSLPGSSIHGIFQARVLEWVAIAFSILEADYWKKWGLVPALQWLGQKEWEDFAQYHNLGYVY